MVTVEIEIGALAHAFKFYKHFTPELFFAEDEMLAIPAYGVGKVDNVASKSLMAIEGMRQGDLLPAGIVVTGLDGFWPVAHLQQPVGIEIQLLAPGKCIEGTPCKENNK